MKLFRHLICDINLSLDDAALCSSSSSCVEFLWQRQKHETFHFHSETFKAAGSFSRPPLWQVVTRKEKQTTFHWVNQTLRSHHFKLCCCKSANQFNRLFISAAALSLDEIPLNEKVTFAPCPPLIRWCVCGVSARTRSSETWPEATGRPCTSCLPVTSLLTGRCSPPRPSAAPAGGSTSGTRTPPRNWPHWCESTLQSPLSL